MEKVYTIIAGVNGAGKSTLYKTGSILENQARVNSDEILRENNGDWKNKEHQFLAMKEALRRIEEYFKNGVSFNQETTLVGSTHFINQAKELGYKVEMYYVGLKSADLAIERVANRVQNGGHGIDEETIRRRYTNGLKNLQKAISMCDTVYIYDNSDKLMPIAVFSNGKLVEKTNVKCEWLENVLMETKEPEKEPHTRKNNEWENFMAQNFSRDTALQNQMEAELPTERE